jgi:hypothetical protein
LLRRVSPALADLFSNSGSRLQALHHHPCRAHFTRTIDDIFAIQDEITLVLATEMQVELTEGEQARLRYTTTTDVDEQPGLEARCEPGTFKE